VKFTVFLRRGPQLLELCRINRTPSGLYLNEPYNLARELGSTSPRSSLTYHEDGRRWEKFMGSRDGRKMLATPLAQFAGQFTSVGITQDLYQHVRRARHDEAAEHVERLLFGNRGGAAASEPK
jgi:hypothetical protein